MSLLYKYVQLGIACALLGSCGVLGRDTSTSWKCMTEGGKETCDGDRGPKGEKGDTGNTGPQGRQGDKGVPGTVGPTGSSGPSGPVGSRGEPGAQGPNGTQGTTGTPGAQGSQGPEGSSCSAQPVVGGALITCTDGTSVVLWNGVDGRNGVDGQDGADAPPTAYTVVGLVDPCGKQSSFDEVLLRLQNGDLLAHYASGNQQFLARISPGSYVTTDGTHCYFTVSNDGSITNEHN